MKIDDNEPELWSAIASLKPSLLSHIHVQRQLFRGAKWFVLSDQTTGKHMRVNEFAYQVIGRFDGRQTVESIYTFLKERVDSEGADKKYDYPDKDEIVLMISQLYSFGALQGLGEKSTEQIVMEHTKAQSINTWRRWLSPLMIRFPLFDPDNFLQRWMPSCQWMFSRSALLIWLLVCSVGLVTATTSIAEIRAEVSAEILKPGNLVLLWLLYPLLKLLHEFAHAFSVKRWGGEVHEMGITLLVLTPIPYVNASASTVFRSKWQRMAVAAAGIVIELFVASVAIVLWSLSEPGLFHDTMLGVFLISAISTLLFNANPLLRFDGYFLLQDWIEIPNLYSRSSAWYRYVFKRYALGLQDASSPQTAPGEVLWFGVYGVASQLYRLFVIFVIAFFLASKFMVLGLALALWALTQQLVLPVVRIFKYLYSSPELEHRRGLTGAVIAATSCVLLIVTVFLPLPQSTMAQGIVWLPKQGQLFAPTAGFVATVDTVPGSTVMPGQLLVTLDNPELTQLLVIEQARLQTQRIEKGIAEMANAPDLDRFAEDVKRQEAVVQKIEADVANLNITAGASGTFVLVDRTALAGRYFSQGELIGHVVDPDDYVVQVVVPEKQSRPLHNGVISASVRLAESALQQHSAHVSHSTPAASNSLPSPALGAAGGGGIAVATSDESGLTTIERVFHLQLSFDEPVSVSGVGERAFVKLRHRAEPMGVRLYRAAQQTFISRVPAWLG